MYHDQILIDTNHFSMPNEEALQAALNDYPHGPQAQRSQYNYYLISIITDLSVVW